MSLAFTVPMDVIAIQRKPVMFLYFLILFVQEEATRVICEGCPALLYLNLSHTDIANTTIRVMSR